MILKNDFLVAEVDELGAELVSLAASGRQLLWSADKRFWGRHAPVLFPIVGKVFDGRYRVDGAVYNLPQHGFARDRRFLQVDGHTLHLLADDDSLAVYPYRFELSVSYRLVGPMLMAEWTVCNRDVKPMYFQIGAHPGFLYPDFDAADKVHGFFVCYRAGERVDVLRCSSLKDGFVDVQTPRPFSLSDGRLPITAPLFDNDALVIEKGQVDRVVLCDKRGDPFLAVSSSQAEVMGLWAPKGADTPFCCIEPWCGRADSYGFDGDISQRDYIHMLMPGQSCRFDYSIEVLSASLIG